MPRPHNERQRRAKIRKILDSAHAVFCKKGFVNVTMQDIIDECGISRGGIYLYFDSIDEIFLAIMKDRNRERKKDINISFDEALEEYLLRQKTRLLNFEASLFRAYCEYIFQRPKEEVIALRDMQLGQLRRSVSDMLRPIVRQDRLEALVDHFIITIDGLSVLALARALTESIVDTQFAVLRELVQNQRE